MAPSRRRESVAFGFPRQTLDSSGRFGDGVSERADEDELTVPEKVHDLAVGPGPQDRLADDEQARPAEIRLRVQARERLGALADAREPDAPGAQPRGHAQADDVGERVAPGGAVAGGPLERRPEKALPVPMVELPG